MRQFRAYIKSRTQPAGNPISSAGMKVTSFSIKRDLMTTASSTIALLQPPTAITEGDIIGVYGDDGRIIYNGIVDKVAENIQCNQAVSLFDDDFVQLEQTTTGVLETDIENELKMAFWDTGDPVIDATTEPFIFDKPTTTAGSLMYMDKFETANMQEQIFKWYSQYGIIVDLSFPFEAEAPTITIGRNTAVPILLSTNAIQVLSIVPETTVSENNKLVIYSKGDENAEPPVEPTYRATYYATPNGITTNASDLSRLSKVNTVYQFSDDELDTIVNANLSAQMYNHQITAQMALDGKLYDFWDFSLGQPFEIYAGKKYYQTILTGYQLDYQELSMPTVTLTFGKVRISLESTIYKLLKG